VPVTVFMAIALQLAICGLIHVAIQRRLELPVHLGAERAA
jgi:hypothetical protein